MKKFFAIAMIAATFVACNEGEKTETTNVNADSAAQAATADSLAKVAQAAADTAKAAADTAQKAANAAADTAAAKK